jgi:AcrR family transcriptional regulator
VTRNATRAPVSEDPCPPPEGPKRRPRGIETRQRLLEATFACLYEVGYPATTTVEVCRRTGISRGSLLHQFPTRADLLACAVEYVFDRRVEAFREALAHLPHGCDREARLIDLLWQEVRGPAHYAWLELVVAARTDAHLRDRVRGVAERFDRLVEQVVAEAFPDVPKRITLPNGDRVPRETGALFALSLLSWNAVDRIVHGDRRAQDDQVRALQGMGPHFLHGSDDG